MRKLFGLLWIGPAAGLLAQPVPRLNSVSPDYVQRGATTTVILRGANLGGAKEFFFSGDPGMTAMVARPGKDSGRIESSLGGISTGVETMDAGGLAVKVTISADAPLGSRELRVVTPAGISNPIRINVDSLPERKEIEPNNSIEQAQLLELPVVMNGKINAATEQDFYRFHGAKGQTIVFDVVASRIGSPLDSSLSILDKRGKVLAHNEDEVGFDSQIAFTVPEEGDYFVQIRDFRFQGSANHRYRLVAGALPYVKRVFPLGGQRGQSVDLTLGGYNLGSDKLKLQVDANAPAGAQDIRIKAAGVLSNPFKFDVGIGAETMEAEPNDTLDKATMASVPGAWNGRIGKDKDVDTFKFKAPADQRLIFDVFASRYGSALDPLLSLSDAKGNLLVNNDDAAGEDARIEFDVKKDQEYVLSIRDLLDHGGENFAYRLVVSTPQPTFIVKFFPDDPRLTRGGTTSIRCELTRIGIGDTITVTPEGLPAGVIAESVVFTPASLSVANLNISAAKDAALGTVPLNLTASAVVNGQKVVHGAIPMDPPAPNAPEKPVRQGFLTVLEAAPFTVQPVTPSLVVEQEQGGALEFVVQRRDGFKDDIKLSVEGFTAGREPITRNFETAPLTVKDGQSIVSIPMKPTFNSEVGTRPVLVKAESGSLPAEYTPKIPVTINQLPFVLAMTPSKDTQLPFDNIRTSTQTKLSIAALPPGSKSAAGESTFAVMVDRRGGFNQEVVLQIEGLPEGVVPTLANIPANERLAVLKLTATDKAPAGKEFQFTVTGASTFNDRTYRQKTRPATLVITAPQSTGKPAAPAPATAAAK